MTITNLTVLSEVREKLNALKIRYSLTGNKMFHKDLLFHLIELGEQEVTKIEKKKLKSIKQ